MDNTNTGSNTTNDHNAAVLQSNFNDDQIFEIDIDQIYHDYIQAIDSKRSSVNTINLNTNQFYQSLLGGNNNTVNNLVPAASLQESRCHAFFRIIGFPVISNGKQIYNPGMDIVNPERLKDKIGIAQSPINGFVMLSNFREQFFQSSLKIFSTNTTLDASVFSLSGGANPKGKRPFFIKENDPYDTIIGDQSYPGAYDSIVGNNSVSLLLYQDSSGNFLSNRSVLPNNKFHIITPFMVDPRIDFSVSPSANSIAVPFVPNKTFLRISAVAYADPPILEIVIRDRYAADPQLSNSGGLIQSFANFIKNIQTNPDQTILGQINQDDIKQLNTNTQFLQFINIIQAMIIKLVKAQAAILGAQGQYYWVPIPSFTGPEGGCSSQGVFLPNLISSQLLTQADENILLKTAQSLFSQTNQNNQVLAADGTPDVGGFAVSLKNSLGASSTNAYTNNSSDTLDTLLGKREAVFGKASDALRTIEIIMGEFSGLGLCDIIAVLAALYTMPAGSLLGFLDAPALARMNTQFNHNPPFTSPGIDQAIGDFTKTVNQFYQLMDAIYQKVAGEQGLSI